MASLYPASVLELRRRAAIDPGGVADLVHLDDDKMFKLFGSQDETLSFPFREWNGLYLSVWSHFATQTVSSPPSGDMLC